MTMAKFLEAGELASGELFTAKGVKYYASISSIGWYFNLVRNPAA